MPVTVVTFFPESTSSFGVGVRLLAAGIGLIFGLPSLRIKGLYLAVTTLAAQFFSVFIRVEWLYNYDPSGAIIVPDIMSSVCYCRACADPVLKYHRHVAGHCDDVDCVQHYSGPNSRA